MTGLRTYRSHACGKTAKPTNGHNSLHNSHQNAEIVAAFLNHNDPTLEEEKEAICSTFGVDDSIPDEMCLQNDS